MVTAEVERETQGRSELSDALAGLHAIEDQTAVLEAFVRQSQAGTTQTIK